jgi:hypothetical protein
LVDFFFDEFFLDDFSAVGVAVASDALTAAPLSGRTIWKIATATPRNATVASSPAIRRVQRAHALRAGNRLRSRSLRTFESIPAEMVHESERYVNG